MEDRIWISNHVNLLIFSLLSFLIFFFNNFTAAHDLIHANVGLVLDMDDYLGDMGLNCISMALSDFYADHPRYTTRLALHTRDSQGTVIGAAAAALDLLKNVGVEAIIGPQLSMQANVMIELGERAQVPIITFSATNILPLAPENPYFIHANSNVSSQVEAISSIVQEFGWREVVLVYEASEFGEAIIPSLTDALGKVNAKIPYRSLIHKCPTDEQIVAELAKLMNKQARVFVVHMPVSLGSRVFAKAKQLGMMEEGYVWIITDSMANEFSTIDPSVREAMLGVIGVKPYIPETEKLKDFKIRYKKKMQHERPLSPDLNIYGLWAYDSAMALAMAIEKATTTNTVFNISRNSTDLESIGISSSGPKIIQALSTITFSGLAGNFQLVDGQIQSSTYQIVNEVGPGARGIGYWIKQNGTTSKPKFGSIIWPGDTVSPPKGWTIPRNGQKMRIGVPVTSGFTEIIHVMTDNSTLEGLCIDVFRAVMEVLPYGVPYELIPFVTPKRKLSENYNDLIYQVYLGEYDAAVGDLTILANRSQYVDFTIPYVQSGASMVVRTKGTENTSAWIFLRPLTWELWLTSFCSILFIGFSIRILEHQINQDFRGSPWQQIGMIFWFSFSTVAFANKDKVVSNLAKFVLIIWSLVVLILTQSYTASFTTMLTVEQLQPTFTDVKELIRNKKYVGYQDGSHVYKLMERMGFSGSRLLTYRSVEEMDRLLSKGSGNGGIAAAFDEIPYIQLLLARYCSKYTMAGPVYKSEGFAFAFPRGSPLAPDLSRAIISLSEAQKITEIERKWLFDNTNCPESFSSSTNINNLGLGSFWGLYLIVAVTAVSAFIVHVIMFLYQNWPVSTACTKLQGLVRRFDKKDVVSRMLS